VGHTAVGRQVPLLKKNSCINNDVDDFDDIFLNEKVLITCTNLVRTLNSYFRFWQCEDLSNDVPGKFIRKMNNIFAVSCCAISRQRQKCLKDITGSYVLCLFPKLPLGCVLRINRR
jgi:hypothetical protein